MIGCSIFPPLSKRLNNSSKVVNPGRHKPTMTGDGWNPTHKNGDFDDGLICLIVAIGSHNNPSNCLSASGAHRYEVRSRNAARGDRGVLSDILTFYPAYIMNYLMWILTFYPKHTHLYIHIYIYISLYHICHTRELARVVPTIDRHLADGF